MKKLILMPLLLISLIGYSQSKKVTELTEDTSVEPTDILYIVDQAITGKKMIMSTLLDVISDSILILETKINDSLLIHWAAIAAGGGGGAWSTSGNTVYLTSNDDSIVVGNNYTDGYKFDIWGTLRVTDNITTPDDIYADTLNSDMIVSDWGSIDYLLTDFIFFTDNYNSAIYEAGNYIRLQDASGNYLLSELANNYTAGNGITLDLVENKYELGGTIDETTLINIASYLFTIGAWNFSTGGGNYFYGDSTDSPQLSNGFASIGDIKPNHSVGQRIGSDADEIWLYIDGTGKALRVFGDSTVANGNIKADTFRFRNGGYMTEDATFNYIRLFAKNSTTPIFIGNGTDNQAELITPRLNYETFGGTGGTIGSQLRAFANDTNFHYQADTNIALSRAAILKLINNYGGEVSISGTPSVNQIAYWTDASTITGSSSYTTSNIVTYGSPVDQGENVIVKINGGDGVRSEGNLKWYDTDGELYMDGRIRNNGYIRSNVINSSEVPGFRLYVDGQGVSLHDSAIVLDVKNYTKSLLQIKDDSTFIKNFLIAEDSTFLEYINFGAKTYADYYFVPSVNKGIDVDSLSDAWIGYEVKLPERISDFLKDKQGKETSWYYEKNGIIHKTYSLTGDGLDKYLQKLGSGVEIGYTYIEKLENKVYELEQKNRELEERLNKLEKILEGKQDKFVYDQEKIYDYMLIK